MKKIIRIGVLAGIISISILSTKIFADGLVNVRGFFASTIRIFNNKKEISLGKDSFGRRIEPFVMNNTTYIPIRALSEVLGKKVDWNQKDFRIDISDMGQGDMEYMMEQIYMGQERIRELEGEVEDLKRKLQTQQENKYNIYDLEDELNREYDLYRNVRFEIELSGNENKVSASIFVDRNDQSSWAALSREDIERYINNMVFDIEAKYRNADILGYIVDTNAEEVVEFYTNSRGKLIIDIKATTGDSSPSYLKELENSLNRDFKEYIGEESGIIDIELSGDKNNIKVDLYVNESRWDRIGYRDREDYIEEIYDYISFEFPYVKVSGHIADYYERHKVISNFRFNSQGNLEMD